MIPQRYRPLNLEIFRAFTGGGIETIKRRSILEWRAKEQRQDKNNGNFTIIQKIMLDSTHLTHLLVILRRSGTLDSAHFEFIPRLSRETCPRTRNHLQTSRLTARVGSDRAQYPAGWPGMNNRHLQKSHRNSHHTDRLMNESRSLPEISGTSAKQAKNLESIPGRVLKTKTENIPNPFITQAQRSSRKTAKSLVLTKPRY